MLHTAIRDAAAVTWSDALRSVDRNAPNPRRRITRTPPRPTHVTVVGFPLGAEIPRRTVLGYIPKMSALAKVHRETIAKVGLPFFSMLGGGAGAASKAIFLPYRNYGMLIFPTSSRGSQGSDMSILQSASVRLECKNPAAMLTLLSMPLSNPSIMEAEEFCVVTHDPTHADILRFILQQSWITFMESSVAKKSISSATATRSIDASHPAIPGPSTYTDEFDSGHEIAGHAAMEAMYEIIARRERPEGDPHPITVDDFDCTTFDGTPGSVYGSILYAVCRLAGTLCGPLSIFYSQVLDACFQGEILGQQDPFRFVRGGTAIPSSEVGPRGPRLMAAVVFPENSKAKPDELSDVDDNPSGGDSQKKRDYSVPILNTVNLISPDSTYIGKTSAVAMSEADVLFILKVLIGVITISDAHGGFKFSAMDTGAVPIARGSQAVNLDTISRERILRLVDSYTTLSFGCGCKSNADKNPIEDAVHVAMHTMTQVKANVNSVNKRIYAGTYVTAMHASVSADLSRLREPASAISKIAYKAAAAISAARIKLSILLTPDVFGKTSAVPVLPPVRMNLNGPFFGNAALEALILARAFLFIGGHARFTIHDGPKALYGASQDVVYDVSNTTYLEISSADPYHVQKLAGSKQPDLRRAYSLTSRGKIVSSIRLFV